MIYTGYIQFKIWKPFRIFEKRKKITLFGKACVVNS